MKFDESKKKGNPRFLALMLASTMSLAALVPVTATTLEESADGWIHNGGALESVEGNQILTITAGASATSNRIGTEVLMDEGLTVRFKFYSEDVSILKAGFKLYEGGTSSSNEVARFKLDQGTLKQASDESTYSDSGSMSASYNNIGSVESEVWHEFIFHYYEEEGAVLTDVYLDGVKLNDVSLSNPKNFAQLDAISFITDSNSQGVYQLDEIQVEAGLLFPEDDEEVEEETDTEVEDETDTEVEEETDTEVEDETDTEVEEETDTEVEDETDTEVEDETDLDSDFSVDSDEEPNVDADFSVDAEDELEVDPDFSVDAEDELEVDPDFSVDAEDEPEVDPDFSVTPENEEEEEEEEEHSDEEVLTPTTTPTDRFVDVEYTHWFAEYVDYVVDAGIMSGMSDDEFGPTVNTSRAMIATIIATVSGQDISHAVNRFQDVAEDKWYTQSIAWCAENGIVTGFTPDTFGVTNDITREQLVTTLYGFANYLKLNVSVSSVTALDDFTDGGKVSDYAKTPMTWAIERGVVAGADGQLNPQNTATRAEVATIFKSFLELAD